MYIYIHIHKKAIRLYMKLAQIQLIRFETYTKCVVLLFKSVNS